MHFYVFLQLYLCSTQPYLTALKKEEGCTAEKTNLVESCYGAILRMPGEWKTPRAMRAISPRLLVGISDPVAQIPSRIKATICAANLMMLFLGTELKTIDEKNNFS